MNFFIITAASIYKSYQARKLDVPHVRTVVTIGFCLLLHAVQLLLLLHVPSTYLMPWGSDDTKIGRWISVSIYMGTLLLIIALIFNKARLEKVEVSQEQLKKTNKILPLYLILSIVMLVLLLIRLGINKGTI